MLRCAFVGHTCVGPMPAPSLFLARYLPDTLTHLLHQNSFPCFGMLTVFRGSCSPWATALPTLWASCLTGSRTTSGSLWRTTRCVCVLVCVCVGVCSSREGWLIVMNARGFPRWSAPVPGRGACSQEISAHCTLS